MYARVIETRMDNNHAKNIHAWIEKAAEGLPQKELIVVFELAVQAVWERSLIPLSEVTLVAIFERVLHNTQKQFPLFADIRLESNGVVLKGLNGRAAELSISELKKAFQFFLTELIFLLGVLTSDLLTSAYYSELSKVSVEYRKKNAGVLESMSGQAEGKYQNE